MDIEENNWWEAQKWTGMKPVRPRANRGLMSAEPFKPCLQFSWCEWAIPCESQNGPSCAGHGMANFKELMLRRYVGHDAFAPWQQLDGDAIWQRARVMFYDGNMDGGLYVPEAFKAALDLGIFAPGSVCLILPRGDAQYNKQFLKTPYIDGHDVSGWAAHGTADNGQVFEGPGMDGSGGHCTVRVSQMSQDEQNFNQFMNSWGVNWGWNGLGIMSAHEDDLTGLEDHVYYVQEPDGWEQWDGWKKWIAG